MILKTVVSSLLFLSLFLFGQMVSESLAAKAEAQYLFGTIDAWAARHINRALIKRRASGF